MPERSRDPAEAADKWQLNLLLSILYRTHDTSTMRSGLYVFAAQSIQQRPVARRMEKNAFCPALTCPYLLEHAHPAQPCRRCPNPIFFDTPTTSVAFGRDRTRPSTSCHERKKLLENDDIIGHNAKSDTLSIPFSTPASLPAAHATGRVACNRPVHPHAAALSPHFGAPAAPQPVGSPLCRGI